MTPNDVLKRIRYIFDYKDDQMMAIFVLGGMEVTRSELSDWLKKEEDELFKPISDKFLAAFLNGLIIEKRGKKEGPPMEIESRLNNNIIFRKLKIALNLQTDDILKMFILVDKFMSPHELSSFFRKPDHRKYRPCMDQYLRNFLDAIQLKYRT